jgi:hypothetical protein
MILTAATNIFRKVRRKGLGFKGVKGTTELIKEPESFQVPNNAQSVITGVAVTSSGAGYTSIPYVSIYGQYAGGGGGGSGGAFGGGLYNSGYSSPYNNSYSGGGNGGNGGNGYVQYIQGGGGGIASSILSTFGGMTFEIKTSSGKKRMTIEEAKTLIEDLYLQEELREHFPIMKEPHDKYLMALKLCRPDKENEDK